MQINWFWLTIGLIPYFINLQHTKDEQVLNIHALFWRLAIRRGHGKRSWSLSIPLITHLKQ
jgi:hypothetical protein